MLIDCNNFFVSCERVFRPDLVGKPVAVLSSNDGCIVARSNEVKALGIPMGVPVFQVRDLLRKHKVTLFSSNFALYGDISDRVMKTLMDYCDDVDVYSIDEAFLTFSQGASESEESFMSLARSIRETILQEIGVPVSIGIAPTRTLAKVASELAKKGDGVVSLLAAERRVQVLESFQVGEVWNIGRAHTRRLVAHNITTAGGFCALPTSWISRHMGVVGLRIYYELSGISCFGEMGVPSERKSIMSSRSFGTPTHAVDDIYQALAGHVAEVARKVRVQDSCVSRLSVMLIRRERGDDMRYTYTRERVFAHASDDTRVLLKAAHALLLESYIPGARYIKAGVLASGLVPRVLATQPTLFSEPSTTLRDDMSPLFTCVDALNTRYGKGSIRLAAEPIPQALNTAVKTDHISPAYTTAWGDIVRVR